VAKRRSSAEIQAEAEALREEAEELTRSEGTDEQISENIARATELLDDADKLDKEYESAVKLEKRLEAIRSKAADERNTEAGDGASRGKYLGDKGPEFKPQVDPFDTDPRRLDQQQVLSRSMMVIDREKRVPISDENKARLDWLIHRSEEDDEGETQFDGTYIARRTLLTENPLYRSAFRKYMRLGTSSAFNAEEQRAVAAFQDFELRRAASENTTTAGGFGVPVVIDPTIIITSGAADAPILRVCRVEMITNNIWKGVSSAGASWSYDTEAAEVSDDMTTLAQPSVTVHMARGFIPYSIEVSQDYPGFAAEMGKLLDTGYMDLIAAKTMTGSGTGEPWGIFTAIDQTSASEVVTTTDGSFGGVDVFKVWNALPERFRSRATWVMSVHVESAIRQFAAAAGSSSAYFTVDLTQDGISRINGRPVITTDYAPTFSSGVPGTTGAANILVVGDFSNYLMAQRAGMSVEQIPHMLGSNRRPSGQRGTFAWARNGFDSVADEAFRLLQNQ